MRFITPAGEELEHLRADPLLWEQELGVRPEVAKAVEKAAGTRAGRVYWRSRHDHLYALELADTGEGWPSMAVVYGHWDRYEPRPPEHEIDADLLDLSAWVAEVTDDLDPRDVFRVAQFAGVRTTWHEGSVLRTPEERFSDLPGFPYKPGYAEVEGLRMAYVEQGEGDPILMLHGEPTWGYLYRRMIPPLAKVGRAIVPDLIGFGRSDKPAADNAYSLKSHVRWLSGFIQALDLNRITLVCQDWGGILGLRALARMPDRFARLVAMNTGIPDGSDPGGAFLAWRRMSQQPLFFDLPRLMRRAVRRDLTDAEAAAYGAPFPSPQYQTAALNFPRLVPIREDHPGAYENRTAIEALRKLDLPVLLAWGGQDQVTAPWEPRLRRIFRNASPTLTFQDAGHFIQEDAGEQLAERIAEWMAKNP